MADGLTDLSDGERAEAALGRPRPRDICQTGHLIGHQRRADSAGPVGHLAGRPMAADLAAASMIGSAVITALLISRDRLKGSESCAIPTAMPASRAARFPVSPTSRPSFGSIRSAASLPLACPLFDLGGLSRCSVGLRASCAPYQIRGVRPWHASTRRPGFPAHPPINLMPDASGINGPRRRRLPDRPGRRRCVAADIPVADAFPRWTPYLAPQPARR